MKIESIAYEEQYINPSDSSRTDIVDAFLIKQNGIIVRKLNGETSIYNKATEAAFNKLEKEILDFIERTDRTVYFIDNMKVSIIITYDDGTKQILERGLACEDEFFDSIIEDYIDEYT